MVNRKIQDGIRTRGEYSIFEQGGIMKFELNAIDLGIIFAALKKYDTDYAWKLRGHLKEQWM